MYARRAAVLCNGEYTLRDGNSNAQKEGRRSGSCLPRRRGRRCVRRACREGHFEGEKLCTVTSPISSAACEPGEATTCTPSVAYGVGATRRPSGACSARTSPIFGSFDQFVKLAAHA